jgi:hypothetical protein
VLVEKGAGFIYSGVSAPFSGLHLPHWFRWLVRKPRHQVIERDQLVKERDEFKRLFEECGIARDCSGFLGTVPDCIEYLDAERDRLALANAELLAAFDDLMSWFPDKPTEPMWQMKAGEWGADAAIDEARALLDKHKATSTEREGE